MAINVNVQDLENYPGNVKRVTVDQESVVVQGQEGDEKYVLKFSTSAYSDAAERTAIQDYYVTDFKSGWARSSGFAGSAGQFDLTATANRIMVKIDDTVSGTNGGGYYEIILGYNEDTTAMSGEAVAEDLEFKIRALADTLVTADIGYVSAYRNASVEYKDSKFWIVSGSTSKYYNGTNRSSVDVILGSEHNALAVLGFDLKTTSKDIDLGSIREALVLADYVTSTSGITIDRNIGAEDGDCLMITDRTNTDYFQLNAATAGGGTELNFSSTAISNNYTANITKVQLLREQDPESGPVAWFENIDKINRHGIKCMINAIDFSE